MLALNLLRLLVFITEESRDRKAIHKEKRKSPPAMLANQLSTLNSFFIIYLVIPLHKYYYFVIAEVWGDIRSRKGCKN